MISLLGLQCSVFTDTPGMICQKYYSNFGQNFLQTRTLLFLTHVTVPVTEGSLSEQEIGKIYGKTGPG